MDLQFLRLNFFERSFSRPRNCDTVRAHIVKTTKPGPESDHLCTHCCFTESVKLAKSMKSLGEEEQFNTAVLLAAHKILEVPTNAQKLVLTRTCHLSHQYSVENVSVSAETIGFDNNCL